MKTKKIFVAIVIIALALMPITKVCAATPIEKITSNLAVVEKMGWEELKKTYFVEQEDGYFIEYHMVNYLLGRLMVIEESPVEVEKKSTYVGSAGDTFRRQYSICNEMLQKFNEYTGYNVKILVERYGGYFSISILPEVYPGKEISVGMEVPMRERFVYYYESAWGWGSGRSACDTLDITHFKNDAALVTAIAYLNKHGEVTKVETTPGAKIRANDVMILLSSEGVNIGWIPPYNICFR